VDEPPAGVYFTVCGVAAPIGRGELGCSGGWPIAQSVLGIDDHENARFESYPVKLENVSAMCLEKTAFLSFERALISCRGLRSHEELAIRLLLFHLKDLRVADRIQFYCPLLLAAANQDCLTTVG
jgi:hypothetical protein